MSLRSKEDSQRELTEAKLELSRANERVKALEIDLKALSNSYNSLEESLARLDSYDRM